jgi:hypothetical protein
VGEPRTTRIVRTLLRAVHLAVVSVVVGFLLLAVLGVTLDALAAAKASVTLGDALLGAVMLVLVALILDGPLLRWRMARAAGRSADRRRTDAKAGQLDAQRSVEVDPTPLVAGELSEPAIPMDEAPDERASPEPDRATTIRLRPLSP